MATKKKTLKQLTAEYKKITGKDRVFKSTTTASKAIAAAKMKIPTKKDVAEAKKKRTGAKTTGVIKKHRIKVGKDIYDSMYKAWLALKLMPISAHQKVRRECKLKGSAEYNGHKFTLVED